MESEHKCGECGAGPMARFDDESFRIDQADLHADVAHLSGWRCAECGEVVFDPESAGRYAAAGDELVLSRRHAEAAEIRRIRKKLRLSQAQAARLTGGGHNAFSRYERGEITPLPAVLNLLKLLDRHPELLAELAE